MIVLHSSLIGYSADYMETYWAEAVEMEHGIRTIVYAIKSGKDNGIIYTTDGPTFRSPFAGRSRPVYNRVQCGAAHGRLGHGFPKPPPRILDTLGGLLDGQLFGRTRPFAGVQRY